MILRNLPIPLRRRRSKWTSPVQVWTLKLCFKCNACIPQTRRSSGDANIYRGLCARRAKGGWRSTIISLVADDSQAADLRYVTATDVDQWGLTTGFQSPFLTPLL